MASDRNQFHSSQPLVLKAFAFANNLFVSDQRPELIYHSWVHTSKVYHDAMKICDAMKVGEVQKSKLAIAALFHDLGHFVCDYGHELESSKMATAFLIENEREDWGEEISSIIMATENGAVPLNQSQQIMKDADLLYIAEFNILETAELLRKEWQLRRGMVFTDAEWIRSNIEFLSAHQFYTDYVNETYNVQKEHNLRLLLQLVA